MPTTDLMNALKISAVTFIPQWRQELSRQASGSPRIADLGPEIWTAKVTCELMKNTSAKRAGALIHKLGGSRDTFYLYDPRAPYPQFDPGGVLVGTNTVTINAIGDDNKSIGLAGLPPNYKIGMGDKASWDQGSPATRCLIEFMEDATADGSGILALTEIAPALRVGVMTGMTVTLKRPAAEMMIQPGTFDFPSVGPNASSITFTAVQV
jgi:hypothetical protein